MRRKLVCFDCGKILTWDTAIAVDVDGRIAYVCSHCYRYQLSSIAVNPKKETWKIGKKEFIRQELKRYREDAKQIGFRLNERLQTKLSGEQYDKIVQ